MAALVAWVELAIPAEKKTANVAWVELETPPGQVATSDLYEDAWGGTAQPTLARVAWTEFEIPGPAPIAIPTAAINTIHGSGVVDDIALSAGYNSVNKTLTISGTASAPAGSSVSNVNVSTDAGSSQLATGTTSWSAVLDVSAWAPGSHNISVIATDNLGRQSSAATITVWHSPDRAYGAAPVEGFHLIPVARKGSGEVS